MGNSEYEIRFCEEEEAEDCLELCRTSWPEWWEKNEKLSREHIKNRIKEKQALVIIANNEIVAFRVWGRLWNKVHLEYVIVKESHRRLGLATLLLNKVIELSKEQGFEDILADCDIDNHASYQYLLKNGFKLCGNIKNYWDGVDSHVLSRKI